MPKLKTSEIRAIDDVFDMHGGYVLDFSDQTFAEFFEDAFDISIYSGKYAYKGSSKAKRLRAFVEVEDAVTVARVLRGLWRYKENLPEKTDLPWAKQLGPKDIKTPFFELLVRLEGENHTSHTDAIEQFKRDKTLEELIAAIERDIQAQKPSAALDRLHTYCMKKFSHLLEKRGITCDHNDPLHSRVGKYIKTLEEEHPLHEISKRIIKSSISIFEQFNDVRNNQSFAHDNDLIGKAEARFVFDAVTAILRFVKTTETEKFGA